MLSSMTGFGKAATIYHKAKYEVTIRTLNSKQLEVSMRTPLPYREHENEFRTLISSIIKRGRVDFSLAVTPIHDENTERANQVYFDEEQLIGYYQALRSIALRHDIAESSEMLLRVLRLPGVVKPLTENNEIEPSAEEVKIITSLVQEALGELTDFREQEGVMLQETLLSCVKTIEHLRSDIKAIAPARIETIKNRIEEALDELPPSVEIDKGRFEQELIYYIEKLDIKEELDRLENHIAFFYSTISEGKPNDTLGKKLSFIAQEMGREINTIGSKSNDSTMQHLVVEMKDSLEQIKEQLANVL